MQQKKCALKTVFVFSLYVLPVLSSSSVFAQNEMDTTVELDMLTVPNSPAFSLLGIGASDVDKPISPGDFAFSVANATSRFSELPSNYAIEILPLSFFSKHKLSYKKFTNNLDKTEERKGLKKLRNNIAQTFLISSGFSTDDSVDTSIPGYIKTRNGTGFKFSLVRGKIDSEFVDYKKSIDTVRSYQDTLHTEVDRRWELYKTTDAVYLNFESMRKQNMSQLINIISDTLLTAEMKREKSDSLQTILKSINAAKTMYDEDVKGKMMTEKTSALATKAKLLKAQIEKIKFKRYGPVLDFAGGMVLGFRNSDFQNSIVQQYAFWFNGGYVCRKNFSFLGLLKFTSALDARSSDSGKKQDENNFDAGAKIEFATNDDKLTISAEMINRFYTDTSVVRYVFNASYQVGKNQALTFSFGKAFTGKAQQGGNLIAALNYVRSFGSTRNLAPE